MRACMYVWVYAREHVCMHVCTYIPAERGCQLKGDSEASPNQEIVRLQILAKTCSNNLTHNVYASYEHRQGMGGLIPGSRWHLSGHSGSGRFVFLTSGGGSTFIFFTTFAFRAALT